jgi:hypothetical protein
MIYHYTLLTSHVLPPHFLDFLFFTLEGIRERACAVR